MQWLPCKFRETNLEMIPTSGLFDWRIHPGFIYLASFVVIQSYFLSS